ncbi:MAG: PhzF family phenazine biosynthesis protein [Thermoanaerobaculia bacterium]
MPLPIYTVDAFTDRPFAGNPAAVCLLDGERPEPAAAWMQTLAAEMSLSETAFLRPQGGSTSATSASAAWSLRWFTPGAEVALCGHATLAAAHVLWQTGRLAAHAPALFDTLSGRLTARRAGDDWIELDFPERRENRHEDLPELFAALGVRPVYFGKNAYDYFVEVATASEVRDLKPDFAALAKLPVRGVIVTARAEAGSTCDFISRFFAPGVGVPEDPVTGSAHCCLAPYWGKKLGKGEMVGFQASPRGGTVRVRLEGERVILAGRAVTIIVGELAAAAT